MFCCFKYLKDIISDFLLDVASLKFKTLVTLSRVICQRLLENSTRATKDMNVHNWLHSASHSKLA